MNDTQEPANDPTRRAESAAVLPTVDVLHPHEAESNGEHPEEKDLQATAAVGKPKFRPLLSERVIHQGVASMSDFELLEVLVLTRGGAKAAHRCAESLLAAFDTPDGILKATPEELGSVAGMGPVLCARLLTAFELVRRVREVPLPRGKSLRASADVFDWFHERMRGLSKERFMTVLLDGKNRMIREDFVSEGILTASLVHPREVFAPAIRANAGGLVLVHNHPSGDPEPSAEDIEVTKRLCAVGELVGIRVLDHVIIGDGKYVSFLERGLLAN